MKNNFKIQKMLNKIMKIRYNKRKIIKITILKIIILLVLLLKSNNRIIKIYQNEIINKKIKEIIIIIKEFLNFF